MGITFVFCTDSSFGNGFCLLFGPLCPGLELGDGRNVVPGLGVGNLGALHALFCHLSHLRSSFPQDGAIILEIAGS